MPMLADAIQQGLGNKFDLSLVPHVTVDQLLSHAESSPVDLFIFLLNNLIFAGTTTPFRETRRWWPLGVIAHLRETCGKPVIALAGSSPGDNSRAEEEAKVAGAAFFFWAPLDRQPFIDAVQQCLKQIVSPSSS